MEDITWALEDIAATIGDALSPVLEMVGDILYQVADAFEGLPDPLKMIIGLVILGGVVLLTLTSLFVKLWGALTMLRGTMKSTSKDASGLFNTFRNAFPFLKGNISLMEKQAILQGALADQEIKLKLAKMGLKDTTKEINKISNEQLLTGRDAASMSAVQARRLAELQVQQAKYADEVTKATAEKKRLVEQSDLLTKGQSKEKKEGKGIKDIFSSIGSSIKNLVMVLGPMAILFLAMGPIIELLSPIFEAIGDAFETVFDSLQPVIDMIVDFIDNNQELVVAILLSIAGVVLFAKLIPGFSGALGKLGGAFGQVATGAEGVGGAVTGTGDSAWKGVAALAALVLALTPLLLAINEILKTVGTFKMSLGELFGYLGTLSINIIAITGALVFFVRSMSGMEADTFKAVAVLIALTGAVDILIGMFTLFLSVIGQAGMTVPEVVGFLFSMAGAIGALMAIMTGIIVILNSFSTEIVKGAAVMILMVVPILMLMAGFTAMFAALGAMGMNIWEMIGAMYAFVGAVLALFTGMAILVGVFAALAAVPFVWMGVALMYALAGAAMLAAIAFLLFSMAIQNLASAFVTVMTASVGFFGSLINSIPQMAATVGIIFALGFAFLALGIALLVAIPGLMLGSMGIAMIAVSITLLAAAIGLLASALNNVPDWARGFVGGIGGALGGLFGAIPHLQEGGIIEKGGVAILHPAEVVTPAGDTNTRSAVYVTGPLVSVGSVRSDRDIDAIADAVDAKLNEKYSRRHY
jgi:hypothetical protein